jgi:RimJ/RimL family protein N-acetyltransferase
MADRLKIRIATLTDVAPMRALSDSVTGEDLPWLQPGEVPEENFQRLIEEITTCSVSTSLLAWLGCDLVGQLDCAGRGPHHSDFVITVHREHRRSGVGGALLAALLEWAREQPELERLQARVLEPNIPSQRLLRRHGFAIFDRQPHAVTIRGETIREELWYLDVWPAA